MTTKITAVAVVNSTVDSSSVGSTVPASGAFTTLTATTPGSSDNSTNVATTAWSRFGFAVLLAVNGYIKFPAWLSGLVIEWGLTSGLSGGGGSAAVSFPLTFPNNAFNVHLTTQSLGGGDRISFVTGLNTGGFTANNNGGAAEAYWLAIGN